VTAPEGASFEYTDAFMDRLTEFVTDSIPEKRICLSVTAPGFGGAGGNNMGSIRLMLTGTYDRKRSQQEIADYLTTKTRRMTEARVFVFQEQTISASGGGSRVGFPIQFSKTTRIRSKIPGRS
jgi:multidrug efflux pump subunit AcrB